MLPTYCRNLRTRVGFFTDGPRAELVLGIKGSAAPGPSPRSLLRTLYLWRRLMPTARVCGVALEPRGSLGPPQMRFAHQPRISILAPASYTILTGSAGVSYCRGLPPRASHNPPALRAIQASQLSFNDVAPTSSTRCKFVSPAPCRHVSQGEPRNEETGAEN